MGTLKCVKGKGQAVERGLFGTANRECQHDIDLTPRCQHEVAT